MCVDLERERNFLQTYLVERNCWDLGVWEEEYWCKEAETPTYCLGGDTLTHQWSQ